MARTFVVSLNDKYDLRGLKKFGDLIFLYTDKQAIHVNNPNALMADNIERLERFDFDPDKDFIVLVGTLASASFFMCAALIEYRKIKVLIYDARAGKYFERLVAEPEYDDSKEPTS